MSFIDIAVIIVIGSGIIFFLLRLLNLNEKTDIELEIPFIFIAVLTIINAVFYSVFDFLANDQWRPAIINFIILASGVVFLLYQYLTGAYAPNQNHSKEKREK